VLAAIISMAQHASPKVSGQMDDLRAQLNKGSHRNSLLAALKRIVTPGLWSML
jgi:hypothetical protein